MQNERGRKIQAKVMLKELEKEQKGLYSVVYNGKNASLIKQDLASVENAIALMQGTRYKGAKHERIKHLTDPSKEGYVTDLEFVSLGKSIREFLKHYEPFIDKNGARLYEWEKEGVRFRVVVNDIADMDSNPTTATEEIITFYSDRNLKEAMDFKNPVLKAEDLSTLIKKKDEIYEKMQAYEREHNYPEFLGFGKNAIKIDDPYYQGLNEEFNALYKKIDKLKWAKFRAEKEQEKAKQEASLKALQEQSTSESPYKDFNTTPKSWKSIEKIKGADYINDLKQWHEKSHKSSKNTDGSPKVFYHGTRSDKFEVFEAGESESGRDGIYFSTSLNIAKDYDIWKQGVYKVFLHYENPLVVDFKGANYNSKQGREILKTIPQKLSKKHDAIIYKNIRDDNQNGAGELADTVIVFNPNQIKHIDNKGLKNESGRKYFNEKSENIYQSNPHLGAGLVGGVLNGLETDEDGNITGFDPAKFAMGFLGGSLGSKAVSKGIKWRANKVKKAYPNIAKDNPALMEQIAKRDLLTYAKNESANALTRFLNKNKLFDSTKGLFAGEKALLNEAYAPHKARLKEAKELENKGADEIEIWEKTGWYKDKDKKWKFEISQRGGEFKWDLLKKVGKDMLSEDRSMRLEEVLQDDALFRAYPQLKELKIRAVGIDDSVLGQYSEVEKNIMLSPDLNSMRAKRTLYHELQHAVQDIEGFAYGDKWELRKNYKLRHGEVEARNVENRLLTRKNDLKKLDKEIQKLTKEIQNEESAELGDYEKFSLALKKRDLVDMLEFKDKILSLDDEIIKKHPHKTMDTPLSETIAESTIQGEALSKTNPSNLSALRNETKELLKPFTHKAIKNQNDNTKAIVTMSGVKEMLSVKAIKQSVKNGFKAKQHIKAVKALPTLFEKAIFKERQKQRHFKDYVEAYRVYSADFEGGKAIISVQERKVGDDVLYFLKLDELRLNNA
ncbi:ADP-ribosyltransferase-containing protein [Campylobacter upsaliensis]|uniref:ADP-ribosyltransferase-containing protein n=1 Tax=Campylobacter upsaliensis TaxID=28080 RepID=UPI002149B638|nr:hypothetical protein [Campylobacter upsaliensis]